LNREKKTSMESRRKREERERDDGRPEIKRVRVRE
jgi:hypothetical protein